MREQSSHTSPWVVCQHSYVCQPTALEFPRPGVLWRVCYGDVMDYVIRGSVEHLLQIVISTGDQLHLQLSFFPIDWGLRLQPPQSFWSLVSIHTSHFVSIVNAGTVERDFSALSCCHLEVSLRKFPRCLKLCQKSGRNPTLNSYCITTHPQPLDYTAWYDILYFSVFTLSSECSIHPPSVADRTPSFCKTNFQDCLLPAILKALPSVVFWYLCALLAFCALGCSFTAHALDDKDFSGLVRWLSS